MIKATIPMIMATSSQSIWSMRFWIGVFVPVDPVHPDPDGHGTVVPVDVGFVYTVSMGVGDDPP